jgi:hypothetical protein
MPDLLQSLHSFDIGHLRIVAGLWGLELRSSEQDDAARDLAAALLDPGLVAEILASLPLEARSGLEALAAAGGRLPWVAFTRRFGELREAGPARRDREQVYLHPVSPAEILFYRALLARAFFDTPTGPQEFAYIPDDLAAVIPHTGEQLLAAAESMGRAATPRERARRLPASDRLLDDATTFLAALRMAIEPPETPIPVPVVRDFLAASGITRAGSLESDAVRRFLEEPRQQALAQLAEAWKASETFDELRQLPGLVCEGEWSNQPLATRRFLLGLLSATPAGKWWSLPAFVLAVKEKVPDFQRPAGDYDSWFIKRGSDGIYLRGFEHWDEVEGALIHYLLCGPLHWLGLVELAAPANGEAAAAFRMRAQPSASAEEARLAVASDGRIAVPRLTPRAVRYQVARFCEWEQARPEEYRYQVTARSLQRAARQGLKAGPLLSLLAKNAAGEVPPAFVRALKRWEAHGSEARLEPQVVLRVSRPQVLAELRRSKAGRFLGEALGPVAAVVKPGAQAKVLAALAEMGLLAESSTHSITDSRMEMDADACSR